MSRGPWHVAVLMGGWSAEREVSLMSGNGVADALESRGHKVTRIDMDRDVAQRLAEAHHLWWEEGSRAGGVGQVGDAQMARLCMPPGCTRRVPSSHRAWWIALTELSGRLQTSGAWRKTRGEGAEIMAA